MEPQGVAYGEAKFPISNDFKEDFKEDFIEGNKVAIWNHRFQRDDKGVAFLSKFRFTIRESVMIKHERREISQVSVKETSGLKTSVDIRLSEVSTMSTSNATR